MRVLDLSDRIFEGHNIREIRDTLHKNGYPKSIVNKLLLQYKPPFQRSTEPIRSNPLLYRTATYIPDLSESVKKIFADQMDHTQISFRSGKTIKECFTKLKDRTPKELRSDLIYKIACKGNDKETCSSIYIGTTGQYLKNRISNHRCDLKGNNSNRTALSTHCALLNHVPDFDNATILHEENNYFKRMTLEALYIQTTPNTINKKTDTDNISTTYCALLDEQRNLFWK